MATESTVAFLHSGSNIFFKTLKVHTFFYFNHNTSVLRSVFTSTNLVGSYLLLCVFIQQIVS